MTGVARLSTALPRTVASPREDNLALLRSLDRVLYASRQGDERAVLSEVPPPMKSLVGLIPALLPREPRTVELALTTAIRGAGGRERPAVLTLALPIEDAWRLPPGVDFKGEVRLGPAPGTK